MKKKLNLTDLKVVSFVTTLEDNESNQAKAGAIVSTFYNCVASTMRECHNSTLDQVCCLWQYPPDFPEYPETFTCGANCFSFETNCVTACYPCTDGACGGIEL